MTYDIVNSRDENQIFARCVPQNKLEKVLTKIKEKHPRVKGFTIQSNMFGSEVIKEPNLFSNDFN
jgi:hypothetical protein